MQNADSIFGLTMSLVKTGATRYRVTCFVCYSFDLLLIIASSISLWLKGSPVFMVELAFVIAIIVNLLAVTLTGNDNIEAYRLYLKFKKKDVEEKTYKLDSEKLYSVLFASGYKKIKPDLKLDAYKEALNSACMQNMKYSRKLYKNLSKYESDDGNITIVFCNGHYVDYKEEK